MYVHYQDSAMKQFALDFLKRTDFNIVDFEIEMDQKLDSIRNSDLAQYILNFADFEIKVVHEVKGKRYTLDLQNESLGTRIIFNFLPYLFDSFYQSKIIVLDELDRSLHPALVKYILELFQTSNNNTQLIFNTHDTNLLDLKLLRRDQIWFTEKDDESGASVLYPLDDFSVRKQENIEKGYLLGRYGAIPFIQNQELLFGEKDD